MHMYIYIYIYVNSHTHIYIYTYMRIDYLYIPEHTRYIPVKSSSSDHSLLLSPNFGLANCCLFQQNQPKQNIGFSQPNPTQPNQQRRRRRGRGRQQQQQQQQDQAAAAETNGLHTAACLGWDPPQKHNAQETKCNIHRVKISSCHILVMFH